MAIACHNCNDYKWAWTTGIDPTDGSAVRLFNPRADDWPRHFRPDVATGLLVGLTPVGRATVERLRVNGTIQVEARQVWITVGLFP